VHSIKLLQAISYFYPDRVLATAQSLPLLAWQLPPFDFGGEGATIALASLPGMNPGPQGEFKC